MKKLILSAAAFTMLLASCSKDEAAVTSNEALVTFNVAAAEMGTRAYGDGVTAHDLEYAIYEKGSYAQPLIAKELKGVFPGDVKQTAFTEKLVKGKTYIALFWADAEVDPYTVDWTKQTVKITDPAALESQDENLDAFFKAHEIVVGQDAQTETIELRRPFAQLNVGTADTADAATAGLVVEQTEVAVRAYTTLNLLNGEVADAMMLTYKMANIPSGENETFTVNGKVYDHLSMNYLLVNAKELVDVTFTVNDGTQNINTSTFAKVPVERNFKTFIIGNLLTSDVNFDVILLPDDWKNPDYIYIGGDLVSTLESANPGSTLVLSEEVDYGTVTVNELKDITIQGAKGAKMRLVTTADSKIENVTVKGVDFAFETGAGQAGGAFVVINKDAEIENLVIEGCNIVGDGNKNSYGIYGQNPNATIVVKNCNFSNVGYAIQAIAAGGYKSLSVEGCTFDNIISWAIMPQYGSYAGDLTITGCTFNNSKGGLVKSGALTAGHTFTFTNNTITNCTGHDGSDAKWFTFDTTAGTAVVSGNKKDGADWTPGAAEGLK